MMLKISTLIVAALVLVGCSEATDGSTVVDIDDRPASAAIEEQEESFRAYANLKAVQDGQVQRFSFHLDELGEEEPAFMGCSGETFSICGSTTLAYCEDGVFKNARTGTRIDGGIRCNDVPDKWDMARKLDCPFLAPDHVSFDAVLDPTQARYQPPFDQSLGDEVQRPQDARSTGDADDLGTSTTDDTTQPTDESDSSDSSSATEVRTRPDGETPTQQPGQL